MPHAIAEALALALAKLGARLEHQILAVQLARQHIGERAAAGTELEDALEPGKLARERAAVEAAELGRGDEVASRPEFACAACVVADAWLVQRELHVALEREPAAGSGDLGGNAAAG